MGWIETLAREYGTGGWQTLEDMVRFGVAVAAKEREDCAQIAETAAHKLGGYQFAAETIRKRSNARIEATAAPFAAVASNDSLGPLRRDAMKSVNNSRLMQFLADYAAHHILNGLFLHRFAQRGVNERLVSAPASLLLEPDQYIRI